MKRAMEEESDAREHHAAKRSRGDAAAATCGVAPVRDEERDGTETKDSKRVSFDDTHNVRLYMTMNDGLDFGRYSEVITRCMHTRT